LNRTTVYFRSDGGAQMGLGHIHRCIAVAQMLPSERFELISITKAKLTGVTELLKHHFSSVIQLDDKEDEFTRLYQMLKGD